MITKNSSLTCFLCLASLAFTPLPASAQSDDLGMWMSVDASKKINKKWSIGVEAEYRLKDDLKHTDRWSIGVSADYKITKWLKADAGYDFLRNYSPASSEATTTVLPENEDYEVITKYKKTDDESFWYNRHRLHFSITGSMNVTGVKMSLRERWQYTYRPEVSYTRNITETKTVNEEEPKTSPSTKTKTKNGLGQNVLRSRFMVEYPLKSIGLTPYASCEMFSSDRIEKMRYSAGLEYDINKKKCVKLYYLYNDKSDDDESNGHVIGVGYSVKF